MSDHAWVLENVAAYVTGGLEPAERERLDQHVAECMACAREVAESRELDRRMDALFVGVRPEPALEDRLIRSLRITPPSHFGFPIKIVAAVAAVLLIGAIGALTTYLIDNPLFSTRSSPDVSIVQLAAVSDDSESTKSWFSPTTAWEGGIGLGDGSARPVRQNRSVKSVNDLAEETRVKGLEQLEKYKEASSGLEGTPSTPELKDLAGALKAHESLLKGKESQGGEKGGWGAFRGSSSAVRDEKGKDAKGAANDNRDSGVHYYYLYVDTSNKTTPPPSITMGFGLEAPKTPPGEGKKEDKLGADYFKPGTLDATFKEGQKPEAKQGEAKPEEGKQQADNSKSGQGQGKVDPKKNAAAPEPATPRKIIIRSGEIEFEIDSFDPAVATILKLVNGIKGGFVATVNSEKLANGKVRGSVVVRVPPEQLDGLVLDLRKELGKIGELKGQKIGSQDITKQYTDLESRLRAARAMEERLLQIIKTGKGEIKDLLAAEKELGVWRTKIEEFEGELRYYANLVALSTLTITIYEREIRAPFAVVETEQVQMGIEVEDVEKAQRTALTAVTEAKGRVTKAELKQHAAGQYSAILNFEVAPEAAGPLRDRLKQLGTVARLDINRLQQSEGGTGKPQDAKTRRSDAQFQVSFYNLANIAPRETVHLTLAAVDAETAYKTILARVEKAAGRVVTSTLDRQRNEQTKGTIQFEVKSAEADAVLLEIRDLGEVIRLQTTENLDTQNVTKSKRGFNVQVWAWGAVPPREKTELQIATKDVPAGYRSLQDAVTKAKGRLLDAKLNEQDKQNINASLDFEIRRTEEAVLTKAIESVGAVFSRKVERTPESEAAIDSKVRLQVTLINAARLLPRETIVLGIEVVDVDQTAVALSGWVKENQGRVVDANVAHERSGRVTGKLVFDVPLSAAAGVAEKFKSTGTVRVQQSSRNPQVPESDLAVGRIDVTLSNADLIVPKDDGFGPQIRLGLSKSLVALSWSLTALIVGILVVLPWGLIVYGAYRLVKRMRRPASGATAA